MIIREEEPRDVTPVERLTLLAFNGHPHHAPGASPNEHLIVNRLRASGAMTLSLVAEDERGIIGHLAYSPVMINGLPSGWHVLAPVSVTPQYQRQGIGSKMIVHSLARLKQQHSEGVVVLGEPAYYCRFGFHHQHQFTVDGVPADYFLAQSLANLHQLPGGVITFHEAFV